MKSLIKIGVRGLVLCMIGCGGDGDTTDKDTPPSDKDKLQGEWLVVSATVQGMPDLGPVGAIMSFKGNEVEGGKGKPFFPAAKYDLDATTDPKQIIFTISVNDTVKMIYALSGDELRLCSFDSVEHGFPRDFTSTQDNRHILLVLKRHASEPKRHASEPTSPSTQIESHPKDTNDKDTTPSDKDTLQGEWSVVSSTVGGMPDENAIGNTMNFKGNEVLALDKKGAEDSVSAKYELDTTTNPKQINFTNSELGTMKGVYALSGDELRVCLPDTPENDRPTDLTSTRDDRYRILVLKRHASATNSP